MRLLVIVPAYNEVESLPLVVQEIEAAGYDYIVIDDGSSDGTSDLPLRMISLKKNYGVGYALQVGYRYALRNGYTHAIQIDGDGQHDVKYVKKMLSAKADVVIGCRDFNVYPVGFFRYMGIRFIRDRIFKKTQQFILDPTSGMRLINRRVMKEFVKNYPRLASEPVSTYRVLCKQMKVREVSVEMRERMYGDSFVNIKSAVKYMLEIVKKI